MVDVREEDKGAAPAAIGSVLDGRYRVDRLIGKGGVGAVYEATRVGGDGRVAIKLVLGKYANDDGVVSRFAREAKAASAVADPHIVRVLDSGSHEGRPFLVTELLVGEDLGARLRRASRLSVDDTTHVILQILRGLVSAHAAGIVHRDLKPDNVFLVDRDGDASFVKIVDFGTSKIQPLFGQTTPLALTHRGVAVGTPLYMSPEQAEALSNVDERSDLYSVGAIAFECLTGRPPHVGETDALVLQSIRSSDAPSVRSIEPSLPERLGAFVDKALAHDRTARFTSARQMLSALSALSPNDPASGVVSLPSSVIVVTKPADPALALADTLPHSSRESRKTPPAPVPEVQAARATRASTPGSGEKRSRPSRPDAAPKTGSFMWSWVAAFVAAFAGVIVTAWLFSIPRDRSSQDVEGASSGVARVASADAAAARHADPAPSSMVQPTLVDASGAAEAALDEDASGDGGGEP
jgi:serine/threonine protein kinase